MKHLNYIRLKHRKRNNKNGRTSFTFRVLKKYTGKYCQFSLGHLSILSSTKHKCWNGQIILYKKFSKINKQKHKVNNKLTKCNNQHFRLCCKKIKCQSVHSVGHLYFIYRNFLFCHFEAKHLSIILGIATVITPFLLCNRTTTFMLTLN